MMNQKEAIFSAVSAVKGSSEFETAVTLTGEERAKVSQRIFTQFQAGEISYAGTVPEGKKLTNYVSGLVSNWLRKDQRLNGAVAYVPKNPGSRAGSGDESLKAMRALLGATSDPKDRRSIETAIAERVAELKPKKTIDVKALPESLRHLVSQH